MAELTDADRIVMATALGGAMSATYGPAAATLVGPLSVVMHTLESIGALTSPTASVATEAEGITIQSSRDEALAAIQAVCEARELMVSDHDRDILTILGLCNREIGSAS